MAQKLLCIYPILNLHIVLDALYMDCNMVDIDLDASQHNVDAYTVNSFTMHLIN